VWWEVPGHDSECKRERNSSHDPGGLSHDFRIVVEPVGATNAANAGALVEYGPALVTHLVATGFRDESLTILPAYRPMEFLFCFRHGLPSSARDSEVREKLNIIVLLIL
jgi:hypothetical protein